MKLFENIKHSCEYDAGGICSVFLLDIRDFVSYKFRDDRLYDVSFVDKIITPKWFYELSSTNESEFTESFENGIYKQQLTTFVRFLDSEKLSNLLIANSNRHLIVFRNYNGQMFSFGSDGGANVTFKQTTGQAGNSSGYQINIEKNSIYPLFQLNPERFNILEVIGTEDHEIIKTENNENAIITYQNKYSQNK